MLENPEEERGNLPLVPKKEAAGNFG